MTNKLEQQKREVDFAYKVRRALTESSENISPDTLSRLAKAREIALSKQKQEEPIKVFAMQTVLANTSGAHTSDKPWYKGVWILAASVLLIAGLWFIYQKEAQQQESDLAEIDAALLVDELPPDAYLDEGFNAYMKDDKNQNKKKESQLAEQAAQVPQE